MTKELKEAATEFFSAFDEAAIDLSVGSQPITADGFYLLFQKYFVKNTPRLLKAASSLWQLVEKYLGSTHSSPQQFTSITNNVAQESLLQNRTITQSVDILLDRLKAERSKKVEWVAPNYLARLSDIQTLTIGPVRILSAKSLSKELSKRMPDLELALIDKEYVFRSKSNPKYPHISFGTTHFAWVVEVKSSRENAREEGEWLISVATSFLRMLVRETRGHFPRIGAIEPPSTTPKNKQQVGAIIDGKNFVGRGFDLPPWYEIDRKLKSRCTSRRWKETAQSLFEPKQKSVAASLNRALGWLSRGRQSVDRSQRFLYFFTAIEALLTRQEVFAPVTDTIARHAGVLWSDSPDTRYKFSQEIKKLYSARSKLVHFGSRDISSSQVNAAQKIAESLAFQVLHKVDLSSSHDDFCNKLAEESFGKRFTHRNTKPRKKP